MLLHYYRLPNGGKEDEKSLPELNSVMELLGGLFQSRIAPVQYVQDEKWESKMNE